MTAPIAIVGMACEFPDARSPAELWETVLAGRQAFRRLPPERLSLADYWSSDRNAPDRTYSTEAAVIEDYEFDRIAFRVVGTTFRSADLTQWLALDVAARALDDAGFDGGEGLPRETTGVFLGNTLTGEFSRANVLRLRWPYVRRIVEAALVGEGWGPSQRRAFLDTLELTYKAPFPPVGEESLAGGMSNTIAGRITNHFDLNGGGFTIDGACASSLLAVAQACNALAAGDLDVAMAGGVDLSIDPFELVGFAKAGALANGTMRIFDAQSSGFWPGEGCGMVVLMRLDDALAQGRRVDAVIRGVGISSDGHGGMTRPEVEGQLLALRRAYSRAGFGIGTVGYLEGHGTGTSVGDATELKALGRAIRESGLIAGPVGIGSIKGNIGHTKAASGAAGLIKATMALRAQVLPPSIGCEQPHPELSDSGAVLRVLPEGESWPSGQALRAGVSGMGFGGINVHVVLEGVARERRGGLGDRERVLLGSAQDAELFLIDAPDPEQLGLRMDRLAEIAAGLSRSNLTDLAAELGRRSGTHGTRAAVVASSPAALAEGLARLQSWLKEGVGSSRLDLQAGVFLGIQCPSPRLGFLFPGQGSPMNRDGGAWKRRFPAVRSLYEMEDQPALGKDERSTAVTQPAIVLASRAGLDVLRSCGIEAEVGIGHSLGELTALHWAGAFDGEALQRIARSRGRAMEELAGLSGVMASIGAGCCIVEGLVGGTSAVIAGLNSPDQTVVSGPREAVEQVVSRARDRGLPATLLPVAHAFHSPLVAEAVPALAEALDRETIRPPGRTVLSTVTGARLSDEDDLRDLLCGQVVQPVRFAKAIQGASDAVDLWIEVGPGQILRGLASECSAAPCIALDAGGTSLVGLLKAVGAAFALGAPIRPEGLFAGRFTRPFDPDHTPRFFASPCESAPISELEPEADEPESVSELEAEVPAASPPIGSTLDMVRRLVAERAELPVSAVGDSARLLGDLHLNSISVGQVVMEAARYLDLPPPVAPTHFAKATVAELALALDDLRSTGSEGPVSGAEAFPAGVDSWVRSFTVDWIERPLTIDSGERDHGRWQVFAPDGHALAESLRTWLPASDQGPEGVIVCLPPEPIEDHVSLLLKGARAILESGEAARFVVVHHGGGGAAFARSLHLEFPRVVCCVVDVPRDCGEAVGWIGSEALMARGYTEARYDATGCRREPVLKLLPLEETTREEPVLGPADVLLVSGGGKGIAAECALAIAQETGAKLGLLGRSLPEHDEELAANLRRMEASGVMLHYCSADVTDGEAIRLAVAEIERGLGPVTAILHGAGRNVPQSLVTLDASACHRTLAPKVEGMRNLLAAVDPERLKLFVAFGSIIARTGMRGEADYALANEWLGCLTDRLQAEHPACRCLTLEWSVWSGIGMGERLGSVEALAREGIMPIPPQVGVSLLRRLMDHQRPSASTSVVITGRFGDPPTLRFPRRNLPFLRFLERPRIHSPGVELVVDVELSVESDPYLDDHCFRGERLLPAVMGLEAMAQLATAMAGDHPITMFEDVRFDRPISVSPDRSTTIRLAALVREPGRIEVVLRSEATAFQVDHFRAFCCVKATEPGRNGFPGPTNGRCRPALPLVPQDDLYGTILFQGGRFQRLTAYQELTAYQCSAEVTSEEDTAWFGRYLPPGLILGDPAERDAAVHAIQACIPHATLLPIGVDRIVLQGGESRGNRTVRAQERCRVGDVFTYDMHIQEANGQQCESWEGLRLKAVQSLTSSEPWPFPLLVPYLERRIRELIPGSKAAIRLERGPVGTGRSARSRSAMLSALGREAPVHHRPDGRPEIPGSSTWILSSHAGELTLAVAGPGPIGCDAEPVVARPASLWSDLLGPQRFALAGLLSCETSEDFDAAATRVWAAGECLEKAGAMVAAPLVLASSSSPDGWIVLRAGAFQIATFVGRVRGFECPVVFAVGEAITS
ncbi:type I polyketide synthase [Tautonia rosea]|uniref:type I polyketide synthase n=1 Tax=Tautonia rosea TaxID=2728037 RepID=UPI00147276F8|nr:type I polyketide synthase [Tautonia rosea]